MVVKGRVYVEARYESISELAFTKHSLIESVGTFSNAAAGMPALIMSFSVA
jgi:hypothetical protein